MNLADEDKKLSFSKNENLFENTYCLIVLVSTRS